MSARDLGGVLESLSDFVQTVSHDLGAPTAPTVKVRAFQEGSFTIQTVLDFLGANGPSAAALASGVGIAFRFYWKNMRRVPAEVEHIPDLGIVRVKWVDGEVSELTEIEWRLYQNKRAKKALRRVVAPLRSGATRMRLDAGGEASEVPAAEVASFEEPPTANEQTLRYEVWAEPDTVSFDPDKKWRLQSRDLGSFTATIADPRFQENVATGRVTIGKTDVFRLAIRTEVSELGDSVKRHHFIERVIDHHRGAQQDALPTVGDE